LAFLMGIRRHTVETGFLKHCKLPMCSEHRPPLTEQLAKEARNHVEDTFHM
jgi:hypothetical protein